MEVIVQFVKMPTSETMETFVKERLEKLEKKYDWIIKADVSYKLENDPTGKGKICDIRLSIPGPRIFATSDEKSWEAATDETIRDLEIQLKKRKAIMATH
ncbi:HPF/RaiA family ribosome-associated protein [Aureibaculum sp. 2210JD6-5]|uniref:HPF/RaiA family ribosome-associated protein n=1 Tax=Aureibaculum sp. 2210JD6-5 TaxID=3103957 RepID=UPI002AAED80E|nr:HPF/RaiA family ribosome-associated protein [Aureibaculum sp. 2210JD6-5]MDY7396561.1 HPF/RaiA family ribosome-associated protein [Aureibaculum sp. 2210JD6-5]